ncbi:hypothetical protein CF165_13920 [Amycolatopsis vastitatis]|uniref:Uncharacterized protein n=1 Tax=Amycolatopsis vastitatis TaxID=1905142 RepID=A0A229TAR1_9PSEU|nr:hypothetical protein CF165_13920 [Amycolatopsis vastitatis]
MVIEQPDQGFDVAGDQSGPAVSLNTVVSMGKHLDSQGCSRMTSGMAGGRGEQADAVRDRNQFVGAT